MPNYILRFQGEGELPEQDVERVRAAEDVTILDSTSRMLLVSTDKPELGSLVENQQDWLITPERLIPLPDTRHKPRRTSTRKKTKRKRAK